MLPGGSASAGARRGDAGSDEQVLFAFDPRVVIEAMHTTTIRASITAYSTAVGPSSFFRNLTNSFVAAFMTRPQEGKEVRWGAKTP
jgi:hypothetical protein